MPPRGRFSGRFSCRFGWWRRPVRPVLGVLVGAALLLPVAGSPASAAPAATVDEVRAAVAALQQQAEASTERYDAIQEDIAGLGVRLDGARSRLQQERAGLRAARADLAQWAVQTYEAGDLATLSLLLSDDPDAVLGVTRTLASVTDGRKAAVESFVRRQRAVVAAATDLQEQQQVFQDRQRDLDRVRKDVESRLARAQQELSRLTGDQRAQLASQENGQDRRTLSEHGARLPPGRPTCAHVAMGPFDARVAKVIAYACAHIGDPYRWGAAGPDRFDCSGLTMMAWRQAGVWLPHNAATQATLGTPVSRADLRPGDLVFFYDPIGHNGIYIGNGLMIHAPRTGDSVKIAPIDGIGSLTAAVRL